MRRPRPAYLLYAALLGCLLPIRSTVAAPAPPADLLTGQWYLMRPTEASATMETIPAEGAPGGATTAIRITVIKPTDPFYQILVGMTIPEAVPEGRRVQLTFWGRSDTGNQVRAVLEKDGPPYNGVLEVRPTLTKNWKQYTAVGIPPAYGPKGLGLKFQVGYSAGSLELAGIRLQDLGPDPERQAALEAISPEATQARIRKYRMGDLKVSVRDAGGHPVPGASVTVSQTAHAFLFGSNIFNLDPTNSQEWQKQYQDRFAALLNFATLPFYWGSFEYEQGKPNYSKLDAMTRWCLDHGIVPKGHPLVWHEVYPRWAPKDPDAAIPLLHQRVTDLVKHYLGLIHIWDVVNEANSAADAADTGEGAWVKRDGPAAVIATALQWARAASKGVDNTYIYNDFNTGEQNVALLKQLKERGALPDAIGIQSHMHGGVWPLSTVWSTTQRFAQFGIPIYYTEVTVLSGPPHAGDTMKNPPNDWLTTPAGEKAQADYVASFYTLLFSHPDVIGITWWDFSDRGAWQNAPAGLVRKDMSPKPAYDRLMNLIHKVWWTQAQGKTDTAGDYTVHAFYGDYRITVTDAKGRKTTQTLTFPMGSGARTVRMALER